LGGDGLFVNARRIVGPDFRFANKPEVEFGRAGFDACATGGQSPGLRRVLDNCARVGAVGIAGSLGAHPAGAVGFASNDCRVTCPGFADPAKFVSFRAAPRFKVQCELGRSSFDRDFHAGVGCLQGSFDEQIPAFIESEIGEIYAHLLAALATNESSVPKRSTAAASWA
jgi:hypothetical protein